MKKKNNNKVKYGVIIAAIMLFLGVGVAYALLGENVNLGGTASTTGDLDVEINTVTKVDVGSENSSFTIAVDKNSVDFSVPELGYPGAYTEYTVKLLNAGNIDAKLKSIVETGLTTDANIEISYTGMAEEEILTVGSSKDVIVKVQWKSTSTSPSTSPINFSIEFAFEQNV